MKKLLDYELIQKNEIPRIPLYMDQVTGYLDELFESVKRNDDEKTLTKTMINNYVKAGLIKSPEKKKYGQEQIMTLIMIYWLKGSVQIGEIDLLLKTVDDKSDMYEKFRQIMKSESEKLKTNKSDAKLDRILELLISSSLQKKYAEMLIDEL
jgi:DNA-binding transcriptional MerR regulator